MWSKIRPRLVWFTASLAFGLAILHCSIVRAETLEVRKTEYTAVASLTAQAAYNGGIWTDWIAMGNLNAICFEIENNYTGNTGITMRCETSDDDETADDGGFDITGDDYSAGTATSVAVTWSHEAGAADVRFTKCVDNIPHKYINCLFDDKAGNNATDDLTVRYSLETP